MLFKHSGCFMALLVLIFYAGASGSPSQTTTVEITGGTIEGVEQAGAGMRMPALKVAESRGEDFLKTLGVADIKAARALSEEEIQKTLAGGMGSMRFQPAADGRERLNQRI